MNPTENKPELPAEEREAIAQKIGETSCSWRFPLEGHECFELADALAPLWPKPAPAPSDAEVAAAVERLNEWVVFDGPRALSPYAYKSVTPKADLRTVLAALKHQHQCLERLHPYGREEIAELQAKLADAQRDRERLRKAVRRVIDADSKGHACLFGYASELKDAIQEARR